MNNATLEYVFSVLIFSLRVYLQSEHNIILSRICDLQEKKFHHHMIYHHFSKVYHTCKQGLNVSSREEG